MLHAWTHCWLVVVVPAAAVSVAVAVPARLPPCLTVRLVERWRSQSVPVEPVSPDQVTMVVTPLPLEVRSVVVVVVVG